MEKVGELEQVSTLIGDIYDAALDSALWGSVLEQTCQFVNGCNAGLLAHDLVQDKGHLHLQWGTDPRYVELYEKVYAKLNPMNVPSLLYAEAGAVLASGDLVPRDELVASRFYREWVEPQGIVDAAAAFLEKSSTNYAVLTVHRSQRQGLVDERLKRRLILLAPHFRRAVAIGRILELYKVEAATLADTLDGIAAALFLVDAEMHIVKANVSGHRMLDDGTVLRSKLGKIVACVQQGDKTFQEALLAGIGGDANLGSTGSAVSIVGSTGELHVAHVLSLTSGARRQAGSAYSAVAAVFVRKATLDLPHPIEVLATHYQLTPTELRVLMAVVQVGGVPEIADVLGVSRTTVKTHLSRLFDKTGTSRQADLVRIVAGFAGPIA
jgi:DNA-binding CsgD family transcriptional regulator